MKERALFYLRRIVNELEDKANVNQVRVANQGLPYGQRRALTEEAEKYQNERDAMNWVYEKILELKE